MKYSSGFRNSFYVKHPNPPNCNFCHNRTCILYYFKQGWAQYKLQQPGLKAIYFINGEQRNLPRSQSWADLIYILNLCLAAWAKQKHIRLLLFSFYDKRKPINLIPLFFLELNSNRNFITCFPVQGTLTTIMGHISNCGFIKGS